MSNEESNPSLKVNDRPAAAHQEASTVEPVRVAAAEETENLSASQHPTPTLDFVTLILSLREGALVALGLVSNEELGDLPADFAAAKYQIEMLALLETKTQGNLTPDETKLLSTVIYELRVAFVEAKKLATRT
jgi:hypothetical protein